MTDRTMIYAAINRERDYQETKRPNRPPMGLPAWLVVLEAELAEAKLAWVRGDGSTVPAALCEVLQVAAVAVACLEECGLIERILELTE
jgi:hypothetical protein